MENAMSLPGPIQNAVVPSDLPKSMQEHFKPVLDWQKTLLASASASMPQMGMAAVEVAAGGMYRPAPGTKMTRKKDGTWTPVKRRKDGRIEKHGAMVKGSALARAGAMAWSVASVVVGQAHLMDIADNLASINANLNKLNAKMDGNNISAVRSALHAWQEIDFASPEAPALVFVARLKVREACMNLYQALKDEAQAMPVPRPMRWYEGFFGSVEKQPVAQARQHFASILRLLPAYMTGMMFLAATDGCTPKGAGETGTLFLQDLASLLPQIKEKIRLVPMIDGIAEAPDDIVDHLIRGREESEARFLQMTNEIAQGKPILLRLPGQPATPSRLERTP